MENTTTSGGGAAGSTNNTDYTVTADWQRVYGTLFCSGNVSSGGVRASLFVDRNRDTDKLVVDRAQLDILLPREIAFDTTSDVSSANDTITETGHGLVAGQACVYYAKNAYALGPTDGGLYYIGLVDENTLTLHTTQANALAGTSKVNLTSGGAVTQYLLVQPNVPLVPGPYIETQTTTRSVPINGPAGPEVAHAAMTSFKMAAASSTTFTDARVTAGSSFKLIDRNQAAGLLQGSSKRLVVTGVNPATGVVTVSTSDGTSAAGTELFDVEITNRWLA